MSSPTDERVDEVSAAYKPAQYSDSACSWLYYVLVAISISILFSENIAKLDWLGKGAETIVVLKAGFLILTIVLFFLFVVSKLVLIPEAERVRRKQLLANALDATITPESTTGYYNNGFSPSIQRLAANVMENSFFGKEVARKMLPLVRIKTFIYLLVWIVILFFRQSSLDLVLWISQIVFSVDILAYWLSLEVLRSRHTRVYEDFYQHFLHNHGEENPVGKATILDLFATYEASKATAGVLLDSKIFFRENESLSKSWRDVRQKLNIP